MNTRLQVEHPVTEMITGLDLVEWQLRVAAGETLPKAGRDRALRPCRRGAHLCRGRVARLPAGHRHDCTICVFRKAARRFGRREGDAIAPFYDPMIAKVIAQGPDRAEALAMLADGAGSDADRRLRHQYGLSRASCPASRFCRRRCRYGPHRPRPCGRLRRRRKRRSRRKPSLRLLSLASIVLAHGADPFDRIGSWALWEPPVHHGEMVVDGSPAKFGVTHAGRDQWDVALPTGIDSDWPCSTRRTR